jgi:hypothetical protein
MLGIRRLLVPTLLLVAAGARPAPAQTVRTLALEVRGGAALPLGEFNDGGAIGWIVGGTLRYRLNPSLDGYLGYDYASFPPDDPDPEVDVNIRDHGVRAGLRLDLRTPGVSVSPWLEAGIMVNRTTIGASVGSVSSDVDSEWVLGGEVGVGLSIPLGPRVLLTPGARLRSHIADFGELIGQTTVSYIAGEVGIQVRP